MDVKDVMNTEVVTCSSETPIREVAQLLKQKSVSGLPVVDGGKVVGIVSEGDILKLLEIPEHGGLWLPSPFEVIEVPLRELLNWEETKDMLEDVGSKPIKEIMTKSVYAIGPDSSIEDASTVISKHRINRLPVVDEDGTLVGIVTRGDIINGLGKL
ncbi:CBS domain-containing protein [Methanolobus profundi]|uniref:CBS domain-containing protein n=1 Tax=Methanolobus profundi TaxID=487685 RepID=A0A1I4U7W7_9EURY|nr:CBS domain-containing protein [Methanolobus profundi]SFM85047.1 CBS domain-containing protein [Methanolobus profundi]